MKKHERKTTVWITAETYEQLTRLQGLLQDEDIVRQQPSMERAAAIAIQESCQRRENKP